MLIINMEEEHTLKVILLGNSSVGKSCIINRYVKDEFSLSTMATISAGVAVKSVRLSNYKIAMQL